LPSDSSLRKDLVYLKEGKLKEAQTAATSI